MGDWSLHSYSEPSRLSLHSLLYFFLLKIECKCSALALTQCGDGCIITLMCFPSCVTVSPHEERDLELIYPESPVRRTGNEVSHLPTLPGSDQLTDSGICLGLIFSETSFSSIWMAIHKDRGTKGFLVHHKLWHLQAETGEGSQHCLQNAKSPRTVLRLHLGLVDHQWYSHGQILIWWSGTNQCWDYIGRKNRNTSALMTFASSKWTWQRMQQGPWWTGEGLISILPAPLRLNCQIMEMHFINYQDIFKNIIKLVTIFLCSIQVCIAH